MRDVDGQFCPDAYCGRFVHRFDHLCAIRTLVRNIDAPSLAGRPADLDPFLRIRLVAWAIVESGRDAECAIGHALRHGRLPA